MTALPDGWYRTACPDCGREVLAFRTSTRRILVSANPVPLWVPTADGSGILRDCYQAHAVVCDYRSRRRE